MVGDQSASLELSSGTSVMAIGGWSGGGMGGGQNDLPAQIGSWIKALHTATTIGGQTCTP